MLRYLKKNTKDSISKKTVNMALQGMRIEFVSRITGLPASEISKLQNSRH